MPAARIDVDLAGTVGALAAADKHVLYSRNRTGAASAAFPLNAHNLYAPFYVSLLPGDISQTSVVGYTTSGTTGPIANNFPGYQSGFVMFIGCQDVSLLGSARSAPPRWAQRLPRQSRRA